MIFCLIFFSTKTLTAQYIPVTSGTKFTAVSTVKNTTDLITLDQHTEMQGVNETTIDYQIKSVTNTGYSLELIPRRIKLKTSSLGNEHHLDTDSVLDNKMPEIVNILALLNKPQTLAVDNHQLISNTKIDGIVTPVNMNVNDADKFFLAINPINFKEGYQWADTIKVDSSIITNQYTINSQTPTTIEVLVSSNINMKLSSSVTGNNITQTMKGFSSGKRIYNKRSSLLVSELLDINIAGNIETTDFNSPFTIKSTSQILVK
ncbi:MAG: hypothetical protein NT153_00105 [Bacteroidetes bacterium]|nr:hypothetical protein [Bacteroidota bacterium]